MGAYGCHLSSSCREFMGVLQAPSWGTFDPQPQLRSIKYSIICYVFKPMLYEHSIYAFIFIGIWVLKGFRGICLVVVILENVI